MLDKITANSIPHFTVLYDNFPSIDTTLWPVGWIAELISGEIHT